MRTLIIIAAISVSTPLSSSAQIQLMTPEDERAWRSHFPKIDDNPEIERKMAEAILYTHKEIPPAYQHQPIGQRYTVFFSTAAQLNGDPRPTNGNREPPWKRPGGLDKVPEDEVSEVRFLWLPPKPDGGVWPVIVYRDELQKSVAVNMPVANGWRWLFPYNAIVGEVLMKEFSDKQWAAYEVRMRLRELNDWDVEVYRPFRTFDDFERVLKDRGLSAGDSPVHFVRHRDNHPQPAFVTDGMTMVLPPISDARSLLLRSPFKPVGAVDFLQADKFFYPTAADQDNIVPRNYEAHLLGSTRESCIKCHQDVLKNVDSFEKPRDWYDFLKGGDGIFSWNPFDPSCFGPPDKLPILNRRMVQSGVVAMYDPDVHPEGMYQVASKFKNGPETSARFNGRLERSGPNPRFTDSDIVRGVQ